MIAIILLLFALVFKLIPSAVQLPLLVKSTVLSLVFATLPFAPQPLYATPEFKLAMSPLLSARQ